MFKNSSSASSQQELSIDAILSPTVNLNNFLLNIGY